MADVLERVCRRRRIDNAKEWALVTGDMRIVIPLDRTVASLAGKSELVLVKRALLDQLGIKDKRLARSSDPNGELLMLTPARRRPVLLTVLVFIASIYKRMSEVPTSNAALDFTAAYKVRMHREGLLRTSLTPDFDLTKRFVVYRKLPMLVGRHERALAIDGDYIHVRCQDVLLDIQTCSRRRLCRSCLLRTVACWTASRPPRITRRASSTASRARSPR